MKQRFCWERKKTDQKSDHSLGNVMFELNIGTNKDNSIALPCKKNIAPGVRCEHNRDAREPIKAF